VVLTSLTLTGWLILLVVAGISGAIGESLAGYSRGGFLTSIALGFVGAVLGIWIAGALHLPNVLALTIGGAVFPVLWSIVGSALFVALLSAFRRVA
jgi:uncharacterized membrane protein YeaQ/YmgE (transglycosylase-associated protein family)